MVGVKKNIRGQSFSTDIIIVVVLLLFGGLFLVVTQLDSYDDETSIEERYQEAAVDSKIVYDYLKSEEIILEDNSVETSRIVQIDVNNIKEELGLKNEFAIVFEKDGNLIKIDPEKNINCVGTDKIKVNDVVCSNG
jgi:hypothetical protein